MQAASIGQGARSECSNHFKNDPILKASGDGYPNIFIYIINIIKSIKCPGQVFWTKELNCIRESWMMPRKIEFVFVASV